ncbi:MAG: PAS domain S-box protein [Deltaproteobacteria bacterium]|nr:PAS domain S-box protein [Deltaproteobacteria bacterium]
MPTRGTPTRGRGQRSPARTRAKGAAARSADESSKDVRIRQLEEQLRATREELRTTVEQLAKANEGLTATNEELVSLNEECQSASEELKSSREELQTLNEELVTVNAELERKVEALDEAASVMENLLKSSENATLFLDRGLRVKRFTPAAAELFHLIASDVGRPLGHLASEIDYANLARDAEAVLVAETAVEREIACRKGTRHYLMRVLPYRTAEGTVDGIVVTFVDLTERKRAEQEVRTTALFPEENPHPILRVGRGGTLLYANRSSAGLLTEWGCAPGHCVPEIVRQTAAAALDNGSPREFETQSQDRDLSFLLVPLVDHGYVNLYGRDVTERRRAEQARKASDERFRTIFDTMCEGFALHEVLCDEGGEPVDYRFLEINPAFERQTGLKARDLLGRTARDVLPRLEAIWLERFGRVALTGVPDHFESYSGDLKRWFDVHAYRTEPGGRFAVVFSDVTARKESEEVLHRYELLAAQSRDIILFLRFGDGHILEANAAAATAYGYTREELLNRTIQELRAPDTQSLTATQMAQAEAEGILFETVHVRRDGTAFPVEVSSRGTTVGDTRMLVSVVRDISERRRMEQALTDSERLYRTIGESIDFGVWVCDPEGRNTYASESFLKLVGLTPEECANFGWGDVLHPDDADRTIAAWKECARTGGRWDVEHRFRGVDGQWHTVLARGLPVRNEHGEIVCWAGINLDIDRLKQAEHRLDLLAQTAGELLATDTPQAVIERLCRSVMSFLECDAFFHYLVDESAGGLRLSACAGVPEEAARDLEWLDFGAGMSGTSAQEGRRIVAEDIGEVSDPRTHLARSLGIRAYACHPLIARDQVVGTLSFGTRRRPRFSGEDLALMKAVADQVAVAVEHWRSEAALRENEQRLRFHVENSPVAVVEWDADFTVRRWAGEAEKIFGWRASETIGRPIADLNLIYEDDLPIVERVMTRLTDGVTRQVVSANRNISKDGRVIHCEWYNSVLLGPEGTLDSVLSLVLDVTRRERYEQELLEAREAAEEASRAKSEFLARMSHEIRTPMNGVLGMTELALLEDVGPKVEGYLRLAQQSAKHLLDIINDILDVARIEAGRVELTAAPFQPARLVESVVSTLGVGAHRKGLTLRHRVDPSVPAVVSGDEGRLRQVLINLVGNAVKFTERGGVTLTMRLDPAPTARPGRVCLCFEVRDTGIGIPPENLSSVFESFSRATRSTHVKYGGTGLGLAISKHLAALMGGEVWIESEPGKGTLVSFTAELDRSEASAPMGYAPAEPVPRSTDDPLRVLLAEDNPVNQLFAQALLEGQGHTVVVVSDGRQALDALSREPFDVVLMDVQMPELDGVDAARLIRQGSVPGVRPDIPIVALTAHALQGDRERFLAASMDDYLAKPVDPSELCEVLHRVTAGRSR